MIRKMFFAEYDRIKTGQRDRETWPESKGRETGGFEADCRYQVKSLDGTCG